VVRLTQTGSPTVDEEDLRAAVLTKLPRGSGVRDTRKQVFDRCLKALIANGHAFMHDGRVGLASVAVDNSDFLEENSAMEFIE
jgi:hypothetical protein